MPHFPGKSSFIILIMSVVAVDGFLGRTSNFRLGRLKLDVNLIGLNSRIRTVPFRPFTVILIFILPLGCISCINYPSNKLSFIRRVLNKLRTHNSLGQRLVVVSCVIFRGFHSLFCPICLRCKIFFKHVVDNNHVCHLFQ